jgi:hypothetical protein
MVLAALGVPERRLEFGGGLGLVGDLAAVMFWAKSKYQRMRRSEGNILEPRGKVGAPLPC